MLHINDVSQYTHNATMTFISGAHHILCKTYNLGDQGNGMDKLCGASNANACITSTAVTTTKTILDEAKQLVIAAGINPTAIMLTIMAHSDAQDEANHFNLIHQAAIGAKKALPKPSP